MKKILLATALMAIVVAGGLFAQPPGPPAGTPGDHWQMFLDNHDTDGNGEVTAEEFDGRRPFDNLDLNGDGTVTQAEFDQQIANRRLTGLTARVLFHADEDRNGEVTSSDFAAYLASLDENGDGELNRQELSAMRAGRPGRLRKPHGQHGQRGQRAPGQRPDRSIAIADLEAAFVTLDENQDGVVVREELPPRMHRGPRGHHGMGGMGGAGRGF